MMFSTPSGWQPVEHAAWVNGAEQDSTSRWQLPDALELQLPKTGLGEIAERTGCAFSCWSVSSAQSAANRLVRRAMQPTSTVALFPPARAARAEAAAT